VPLFRNRPELLAPFREGRRDALEVVYRTYVRWMDRYIRALARASNAPWLARSEAVADLVQDIFLRAFSRDARNSYDGLRDYGPYLTTIARNRFVDALRVSGREIPKDPEELAARIDDHAPPEDAEAGDPRISAVVARFVAELPATLRSIYEQRFVLCRSQGDASATLGLTRRRVRTGEQRLRAGLRKALKAAGISLAELAADGDEVSPARLAEQPVLVRGRS
jgi:RNA polymerase sigma-70 factor (ECF subfamily)